MSNAKQLGDGGPATPVSTNGVFFVSVCSVLILLPLTLTFGEKPAVLFGVVLTLVMVPGLIWISSSHPKVIPYLLIVSIYLSVFSVMLAVGFMNVRPNEMVALLGACVIGWQLLSGSVLRRQLPFLILFLWANAIYLLSTLLNHGSPFFSRGVADCVLFFINVLQYSLIVWFLASDRKAFDRVVRFFLYAGTIYAGLNVFMFTLGLLGVVQLFDDYVGETGDFVRLGNLGTTEGTYIGFNVVVIFGLLLLSRQNLQDLFFPRKRLILMLGVNCVALLLTFARGPWLAVSLAIGMLVALLVLRLPVRNAAKVVVNLTLVLVLLTAAASGVLLNRSALGGMLVDRFSAFSSLDVGSAADRMVLWQNMWEDWKQAPWLGHGAHDYAKFRWDPATQISENFLLEFLHSAGLVGFSILCFVIVKIIVRGVALFASAEGLRRMPWGLPILGGFASMCLSSLTNPGMTGGFFWVGMAFLVCAEETCAASACDALGNEAAGAPVR